MYIVGAQKTTRLGASRSPLKRDKADPTLLELADKDRGAPGAEPGLTRREPMTIHGFPPAVPFGLDRLAQSRRRADLDTLQAATQSSNLEATRNAVASLNLDTPANNTTTGADSFRSDLKTLIDAVRKGDLAGAQQALSSLENDLSIGYDSNGATLKLTSFSITIQFTSLTSNGLTPTDPNASIDATNPATSDATAANATNPATATTAPVAPATDPSTSPADPAATTPASPASPTPVNPIKALIDAIRSGDMDAAQKALSQLESAMHGAHGHHHHHHHHHAADPNATTSTPPTSTDYPGATS